ncbi:UPF0396 protein [Olea europaea subsp. europaea]|uniref:UPF0396 protein n=1 Tax=Olea europaea subsp. europaea TaxID=158383 RepID=A0A8S0PBR0_OLEEU|nr:UPF0396 protein [Olea europaea subsp. europaea]
MATTGTVALLPIILRTLDVARGPLKPYSSTEEIGIDDSLSRKKRKSRKLNSRRRRRSKSVSEIERGKSKRSGRRRKKSNTRRRSNSSESETDESETEDSDASDHVSQRRGSSPLKKARRKESDNESSNADESSSDSEIDGKTAKQKVDEAEVRDKSKAELFKELIESRKKLTGNEQDVGLMPLPTAEGHISYGGALRPGEGDAIAQYVQRSKHIPHIGEVGLSAEEIQKFETLGYVMSGSRHQRMNAIRIRKANQVYSAEDKRALAMLSNFSLTNFNYASIREFKDQKSTSTTFV